jgi:Holliday junction resolvase RusA-like endonuclease
MTNYFSMLIDPVTKPRQTRSDKWKKRDCVVRYRQFADKLRLCANIAKFELADSFEIRFNIAMPKSASKKKSNELLNMPHQQKPDIDNLLKAVMDALKKDGDQSVYSVMAVKYWSMVGSIEIENKVK